MNIENPNYKEWMKPGTYVKVQHFHGKIIDVCISETNIMLQIESPKTICYQHNPEWLPYMDGMISPVDDYDDLVERSEIYLKRAFDAVSKIRDFIVNSLKQQSKGDK